ncbi:MAG TPA: hypothetical protein VLH16_04330 [Bacteroidales bacterium]|nr:hypothetical protein [Bacteroidales bacterium]
MGYLTKSQECRIDIKGRLLFPAIHRKEIGEAVNEGFVVRRAVFTRSLELYTKTRWGKEVDRLVKNLNPYKKEHRAIIRNTLAGVKEIELDSAGRLLIPKDLLTFAEISDDVVIAGALSHLEIWSKVNYENELKSISADDYRDLVERELGGVGNFEE